MQHDRTKHVVNKAMSRDQLVAFPFVKTRDQLADVPTKPISSSVFFNSLDKFGMRDIFAPTYIRGY